MNPTNQNLTGIVANPYSTQGSNTLNLGNPGNLPTVPNTLNAGNIGSNKSINTPPVTNQGNFLNELTANYQTNLNSLQNQQQNTQSSIQDLMNQLTGQTGDKITAENQAGLPALNTQIRDLQTLSQRQLAAYAQNIFNNDINATGITRTAQTGNEAMITRQHGIDAMITNANISAISGQIQTAQAQVDRAMSLKYDPLKQQIENQKFILEQVNTKEARAASNIKDFQLKQIDKQQQNEKDINNVMIEAAKNQAPASVLANIRNATTVNDAVRAAGPYMADQVAKAIQYAQLAKLKADTQEVLAKVKTEEAKTGPQAKAASTELKTNALTSAKEMAQQILTGNASGAIGAKGVSSLFGIKGKPIAGTDAANFVTLYDNFKSLLSLENIKYLKGQGSVSDAERITLEKASSKLSRDTSESQFKRELYTAIKTLGGNPNEVDPYADAYMSLPDGEILVKDRRTGEVGSIPEKEANPLRYEKL